MPELTLRMNLIFTWIDTWKPNRVRFGARNHQYYRYDHQLKRWYTTCKEGAKWMMRYKVKIEKIWFKFQLIFNCYYTNGDLQKVCLQQRTFRLGISFLAIENSIPKMTCRWSGCMLYPINLTYNITATAVYSISSQPCKLKNK